MKNKLIFYFKIFSRRTIYISLGIIDKISKKNNPLFILCYHSFSNDNWRFSIDYKTFEKQLNFLIKNYTPLSLDDLDLYLNGSLSFSKPAFIITIDDGYKDVLKTREIFKKNNIKPALFVLSDLKNLSRKELDTERRLLTNEDILNLHNEGWIIGSHGATHRNFSALSDKEIVEEVINSKIKLEKELNIKIKYFAYPKGKYSERILSAVLKAGYLLGLTMNDDIIDSHTSKTTIPRIGIDRTHSFMEFKSLFRPSAVMFRKKVKKIISVPI